MCDIPKPNYLKVEYLNKKIPELQEQRSEIIAKLNKYQTKDNKYVFVESDIWLRVDYLHQQEACEKFFEASNNYYYNYLGPKPQKVYNQTMGWLC
jgi:hypothetical protein